MEDIDAQVKEIYVAVAAGQARVSPDLVADALHYRVADGLFKAVEDLPECVSNRVGEQFEWQDVGGIRLNKPHLQIAVRRLFDGMVADWSCVLFEIIGFPVRLVVDPRILLFRKLVLRQVFPGLALVNFCHSPGTRIWEPRPPTPSHSSRWAAC